MKKATGSGNFFWEFYYYDVNVKKNLQKRSNIHYSKEQKDFPHICVPIRVKVMTHRDGTQETSHPAPELPLEPGTNTDMRWGTTFEATPFPHGTK